MMRGASLSPIILLLVAQLIWLKRVSNVLMTTVIHIHRHMYKARRPKAGTVAGVVEAVAVKRLSAYNI